jgi:hypothetical protein
MAIVREVDEVGSLFLRLGRIAKRSLRSPLTITELSIFIFSSTLFYEHLVEAPTFCSDCVEEGTIELCLCNWS